MKQILGFAFCLSFLLQTPAYAQDLQKIRWTSKDQIKSELSDVIAQLSQQIQRPLRAEDFRLVETRTLKSMNFSYYQQMIDGVGVRQAGLRIWSNPDNKNLIQMIAYLKDPATKAMKSARAQYQFTLLEWSLSDLNFVNVQKIAKDDLAQIYNFKASRQWQNDRVVLFLNVFGKDRSVEYQLDPRSLMVLDKKVRLYPRADQKLSRQNLPGEYSVQAHVFKVNEDNEMEWGRKASGAQPEAVELRYLKSQFKAAKTDWTLSLPQREFSSLKEDAIKAETPEGRAEGYWSTQSIQEMIDVATQVLPDHHNQMNSGAYLDGRYVQVLIHNDAFQKFNIQNFTPFYSTATTRSWGRGTEGWVLKLASASYGRPFFSQADLLLRKAPYEQHRDTNVLINEGFDEMQVYWSVTKWFEVMHEAGFLDQELSTRPIQAFLFDPDIESQNNAYYNADTINFTTYTDDNINHARNLITVWHELGHGLMDRLQGSSGFDNGGLSEGIADFAAEMVLRGYYKDHVPAAIAERRIANEIGFDLTSEGHDDGEAYGGSLKDVMDMKIASLGFAGYLQTCDLVLDAMRLTRQSPDLSLQDWYEALALADELGKPGLRAAHEFAPILQKAFSNRNYVYQQPASTKMNLFYNEKEVTNSGAGSRSSPIKLSLAAGETQDFNLKLSVASTNPHYTYPLKVVVSVKETNALQGSAKFKNEENQTYTIDSAKDTIEIPLTVMAGCDAINTSRNSCSDFANVQVFSAESKRPFAKKRFYIESRSL